MAGPLHLRVPIAWKLVIQDWEEREREERLKTARQKLPSFII